MATLSNQEAPSRAKRAPAPSKKLTDTSNTATPELSAHSEAIALKRAEDAKRLADQIFREQNSASSTLSAITQADSEALQIVSPAKRSRNKYNDEFNPSLDVENDSTSSASPEKPKSKL
jgi:hypothetical protein